VVVPSDPPLRRDFEAAGAAIHIVPMHRISTSHSTATWIRYAFGWPIAVARLTRLIRSLQIDVVHTNSLHSWYGWAAAALARRPHVWHAREIAVQSRAALRVERFLTKHGAVKVIAMSHAIADQLDARDIVVVYETADPAEFHPGRAGRFRSRVGIPDDAPLVGTAGRIDIWKGVDVLLAAWVHVKEARPAAHLAIAGGPVRGKERYFADLAAIAAEMADVHWLGPRDDIPAVVTDAGGPPEILRGSRPGAGQLVPPRDPEALAAAVVASVDRAVPTTTERRATRSPLRDAEPEGFAAIFRGVVNPSPQHG
jgi:glycosyltransferase involved in cell wall biosynthesis